MVYTKSMGNAVLRLLIPVSGGGMLLIPIYAALLQDMSNFGLAFE